MKKIVLMSMAFLAISSLTISCGKGDGEQKVNTDSIENVGLKGELASVNAQKDSLTALMNDIADGMNQIIDVQDVMSISNLGSETVDKKNVLRDQVMAIQVMVKERERRLAELEKKLNESGEYSDDLKKQVSTLKKQLENQKNIINKLTAELQAANVQISKLNTKVENLETENTQTKADLAVEKQNVAAEKERSAALASAMNECFYVIGSKKELKEQKIIETGFLRKTKVMEGDYTKSYFTKADKRTLTQLELHNKKAQVMSKHPEGSYVMEEVGGQKVLRITNPARFWELSNYLVIKVG
ncbi:MAG: hypothetical protein Q4B68_06390 [Bacteroidales bacterium]|nr:hypothetical protein [Bacteroidales bacterium]